MIVACGLCGADLSADPRACDCQRAAQRRAAPSRFEQVAAAAAATRPGGAGDPLTLWQAARAEERPS